MDGGDTHRRCSLKERQTQWKQKLRENCLKRVRHERSQLLWKIRSQGPLATASDKELALRGILSNEISRFTESPGRPRDRDAAAGGQDNDMLWEYEPQPGGSSVLDSEEYASLILEMEQALYEDARRDLEAREASMLEEYEKTEALEDQMVDSLLRHSAAEESGVLCPMCRRGALQQEQQIIFCCCGFRLDTLNDQIGLMFLKNRLAELWQKHADLCKEFPSFLKGDEFGFSALYMQCNTCYTFDLVI